MDTYRLKLKLQKIPVISTINKGLRKIHHFTTFKFDSAFGKPTPLQGQ